MPSEEPILFIVNHGSATWEAEGDEYCAFVNVFDVRTGERLPSGPIAIGGVGRSYRVSPDEQVAVGAAFSPSLAELPAGEYDFEAVIPELTLRSERRRISLA
jgi:hypothetical protein